ncbi:MAG: Type I restriction-modification system, restriction subunit R (EC [uncultured Sulfurovum sp.]|uniref:Type I restriction enzyme endonuclease subunit n=1 Tax=uncultured Sulfurovum sp. TaxID=269237 RepID=A0A6S6SPW4_9BACT|nr:MAG: Type I restriction-modification system, restriction subunit R (EC [uncultured Sulfurovum sp.]
MAYLDESDIEESHIELFENIDYKHISAWKDQLIGRESLKEVVLKDKLKTALEALNPHLPKSCIDDALSELCKSRVSLSEIEANQEVYELLKEGVPVSFSNAQNQEEHTKVRVINFEDATRNSFHVVSQLSIEYLNSNATRRPDLLLYVNGLPLVMVELKNNTVKIKTGYDKNLQEYRRDIPQLFYYNLFVLISNGIQTRIGSFTALWEHFFTWTKEQDISQNHEQPSLEAIEREPQLSLQLASKGLCGRSAIVDYLENFVLYHRNKIKILAKNHQFLGVNATVEALKNRDGSGKLGTFWHTQGSGKSYSMIFFTKKVNRKIKGNWSFLILTDRNDLDEQIFKNFLDTQTFQLSKSEKTNNNEYRAKGTKSRKQLEEALTKNKSYYFSTIFNFGIKKGKTYTKKSDRDDWVVIVDEAHRSQYKGFGENIRIALPNAQYLAFTGTPIVKKGLTEAWFGSYISEYNFAQSIEDGATVPLYYKKSVPRVEQINDELVGEAGDILDKHDLSEEQQQKLDREYTTLFEVVKRDDRLNEIAKHIVQHFPSRLDIQNDEGKRKPMKAMVVSIDKFTAVKMYDKVQYFVKEEIKALRRGKKKSKSFSEQKEIDRKIQFLLESKMAVVISQEGSEKEEKEKFAKEGLDITTHRKLMSYPDEDGRDIEEYFKDPNNTYRIVFVTAMWMTGFDAPSVSTLYLDKPMKNHTLMQTIARANRVFDAKRNGLIVDYFGVFRNLQRALSVYAEGSSATNSELNMPVKELEELLALLNSAIAECKEYLFDMGADVDKIHALGEKGFSEIVLFKDYADVILKNDEQRKAFNLYVNTIVALYDSAKPEVYNNPKLKKERDLLLYLKAIVNRQLDADEILEKVKDEVNTLLDNSVLSEGDLALAYGDPKITDYKEINLAQLDFEALRKEFPVKKHKNIAFTDLKEFMALKLKQMLARNKTRGNFLEDFERIIDEYNNGSVEIEKAYEKLLQEANTLSEEENRAMKEGLSEEQLEIFDLLKKEKLSKSEKSAVKKASVALLEILEIKKSELFVDPWYKENQKQEKVRNEIREVLNMHLPETYDRDIFGKKSEIVYSHVFDLAEQGFERYLCA